MNFYKKIICFVLIIAIAYCALPIGAQEAAATDLAQIVRLLNDIPRGKRIGSEDVITESVAADFVPKNAISDLSEVVGSYAAEDLYKGEYVSSSQVSKNAVRTADPSLLVKPIIESSDDYVIVTDYVIPNTGDDVSYYLQQIIDKNPKRTIYFPDGVYTIAYPLTTPAKATDTVSIRLSDGAVIKAHANWHGEVRSDGRDALIRVGATDRADDFVSVGSYYSVMGGTLDGGSKANGINIECGLEIVLRDLCIKNALVGILIKDGVHNSSSCVDVEDVTIIGDGLTGDTGVKVIGYDNTFSNIRIYNMPVGFAVHNSGGNFIKGVYVKNSSAMLKPRATAGIVVDTSDNWVSECYVENCNTAYSLGDRTEIWDCSAVWSSGYCKSQTAFAFKARAVLSGCRADFDFFDGAECIYRTQTSFIEGAVSDTRAGGIDGVSVIPREK